MPQYLEVTVHDHRARILDSASPGDPRGGALASESGREQSGDTDAGDAPVIVALHSTGLSSAQWGRLIRHAEGYRVLAPDLLGYGGSEAWREDVQFRFEYDLELLERVVELASPAAVHLVGHSYGGRLSAHFALKHPCKVRSMALFEPVLFGILRRSESDDGLDDLRAMDPAGTFLDPSYGQSDAWVEQFVDFWNGPGAFAEMGVEERVEFSRSRRKMFDEVCGTTLDPTGLEELATLAMPILVLTGTDSPRLAQMIGRRWGEAARNVTHQEVAGGHLAPLTHARPVAAAMLAYLRASQAHPSA